jgi:fumarylpyruvate hydrolase
MWTPPALPVAGSSDSFPVRRIFCVGRNYAEHQKEMGGDGREQPFFFLKTEFALVPRGGTVHYPAKTSNYHYETAASMPSVQTSTSMGTPSAST